MAKVISESGLKQKGCCNCTRKRLILELNHENVKIILDAGHGGSDTGEIYGSIVEKDENLKLALAVGEILSNNGMEVDYSRSSDVLVTNREKLQKVREEGGDLLLTLHRTMQLSREQSPGVESIVSGGSLEANTIAANINKSLAEMGYIDYGIIQVEGNIESPGDMEVPQVTLLTGIFGPNINNLQYGEKFDETATAIAKGVLDSFQVQAQNIQSDYRYRVQVGLFRIYNNALNLQMKLIQEGYMAEIVRQGDFYAVQVGDFSCLDAAASLERRIRMLGYNTLLIAV